MRVLVVGARGFVGVELTKALLEHGHSVIGLEVRPDLGRLAPYAKDIEWLVGNCADPEVILNAIGRRGVDAIYYGPFYRSPSAARNLSTEFAIMGTGALNVFNLARVLDIKRIIFPSSIAVHGVQAENDPPLDEISSVRPFGVYGATKLTCEHWARDINAELERNVITCVRLSSVYGPGADIASRRVNVFPVQAARGKPGQVDYQRSVRLCMAHVVDCGRFLCRVLETDTVRQTLYELGGLNASFGEIADTVTSFIPGAELAFGSGTVSPLPFNVSHELARAEFGLQHRSLEDGMKSIIDYERQRK